MNSATPPTTKCSVTAAFPVKVGRALTPAVPL